MTARDRFDVVVLGSGFGGSLLSTILSRQGMSVAMVDRSRHPRFAIGESSTPAADLLLGELATRHQLPELQPLVRFGTWRDTYPHLACGCKRGFTYFWHAAAGGFRAAADHRHELLVTANASRRAADTQWYRPDLDHFLATVAESRSVTLLEGANVTGIEHARPHAWTLAIDRQGTRTRLRARFLVDASGPAGALMRHLSIADWSDRLQTRSAAVYGHWDNVRPLSDWLESCRVAVEDHPYPPQDSVVHHLFGDGWLWQIGFENGRSSLGYVFAGNEPGQGRTPAETWQSLCERHPVLREILGRPRLAAFPGRLYRTRRLQRLRSAAAGEDWAALPFTVGFVDPLHSTGIAHTLSGIERLARILPASSGSERARALQEYSRKVVEELRHIDRLVAGCYRALDDFRLFTAWSMLYFAAATTFERRWLADSDEKPGYLLADDRDFVRCVRELSEALRTHRATSARADEKAVSGFCSRVEESIRPFNHVGLFEPAVPNMYRHTSAAK